jgi:hypothetical protein
MRERAEKPNRLALAATKKPTQKKKNPAANKLTLPISIPTLNGRPQKRASVYFCASFQSQKRSGLILWRNATF